MSAKTQIKMPPSNKRVGFLGRLFAYLAWEAGVRWSSERGQVGWGYSGVQDPNEANDQQSREEIDRKAQHYERNNAIVNRLVDVFELFTVGAGGMPILAASSDAAWNAKRQSLWDRWCEIPDLTSLQTFGTLQGLAARRWFVDGRVLIFLTGSDRATGPVRPRIQLIEAFRLKNPSGERQQNIIDGIQVDSKGRPIAYYVSQRRPVPDLVRGVTLGEEKIEPIPAESIIDISEPMRPGEYHPFSFLAPVLNDVQDLDELCKLAKQKARSSANITNVFNTESGEVPDADTVRRARYSTSEETNTEDAYTKERVEEFRRILGPRTIALRVNEKVDQVGAKTPNEIEQAHWDIIVNRICAGVGISKLLVFPNSMQGTVVRADLDIANTFFRSRSSVLQGAFLRVYKYVTREEIKIERSIADAPKSPEDPFDWARATIRSPRGCNVDVGRNSAAMIAEYMAGMRTLRSIYAELGLDWRAEVTQSLEEKAFMLEEASRLKLPPQLASNAIAEALEKSAAADAARQKDEDTELQRQAA